MQRGPEREPRQARPSRGVRRRPEKTALKLSWLDERTELIAMHSAPYDLRAPPLGRTGREEFQELAHPAGPGFLSSVRRCELAKTSWSANPRDRAAEVEMKSAEPKSSAGRKIGWSSHSAESHAPRP